MTIADAVKSHRAIYVRMANVRLRNTAQAEDLVQDAILIALERPDVRNYIGFLTGTVRQLVRQGGDRRVTPTLLPADAAESASDGSTPETQLQAKLYVLEYVAACEAANLPVFRRPADVGIPNRRCRYCGVGWLSNAGLVCNSKGCRRKTNRDFQRAYARREHARV